MNNELTDVLIEEPQPVLDELQEVERKRKPPTTYATYSPSTTSTTAAACKLSQILIVIALLGLGYYYLISELRDLKSRVSNLEPTINTAAATSSNTASNFWASNAEKTIQLVHDWNSKGDAGEVVFLNASKCTSDTGANCYANNVDGYYCSFNFSYTNPDLLPDFTLREDEAIELLWLLPETPLRYLGVTAYVKLTSSGVLVFGDVGETLNMNGIARACNLSSTNLLWGSMIRILFSTSEAVNEVRYHDQICTMVIPIPGPPLTNLTGGDDKNVTRFNVIMRLTLPESETTLDRYLNTISNFTALRKFSMVTRHKSDLIYPYPTYFPRSVLNGEMDDPNTVRLFKALVNEVVDTLYLSYKSAITLKEVQSTAPWLGTINYTYAGGFACINTSTSCQGAQVDATYMRSRLNNVTQISHFITVGIIHHDFLDTSYYSSMSLYKLESADNLNSGAGILSFIDTEMRGSAMGYLAKLAETGNFTRDELATMKKIAQSFYVIQTGYNCLSKLPSTTRCQTFTPQQIAVDSNIFMLGRTYANPGPDPVDLIPDVVLHVAVNEEK